MPSTDLGYHSYSIVNTNFPFTEYEVHIGSHDLLVSDSSSPGLDHPFEVEKSWRSGATVDTWWHHKPSGWSQTRSAWPTTVWYNGLLPYMAPSDKVIMASAMLANTNPTRADVLIPNFLFELRDMPMMLKDAGDLLLGTFSPTARKRGKKNLAASQYLAYNFGWAPLISDVKKMFSFTQNVNKRTKEWNKVYSSGGFRRRFDLGTNSAYRVSIGNGVDTIGNFTINSTITRNSWGTVRWRPSSPRTGASSRPTPNQIKRMVLGLSSKNITANVWESLPWSWLVDWFTNVGDVLTATAGRDLVLPEAINVMSTTQGVSQTPHKVVLESGDWEGASTLNSGAFNYIHKERSQPSVTIQANMGILNPYQLSILGSLALLRAR